MPTGAFIDGRYLRSDHDPRPKATLYSLGIFSDPKMDERFRALVGMITRSLWIPPTFTFIRMI